MATESSDLSLLFRIRADASGLKAGTAEAKAAVAQLRQSFGPQLTQTVTVANKTFTDIGDSLQNFVAQRVPLVGGALVRLTDGLKSLSNESPKSAKAINAVANSIQSIATQSGKSIPQVTSFLTRFVQIEGQAKRNEAAFSFFGGSVDLIGNKTAKFIPELEKAGAALATVSAESATAGASIAAVAGPVAIAVLALAAMAAAAVLATKEIFNLAKASADYQGKLFDLSQQVGVSVETLSTLEVAARTTGGSIESLTQSLGIFQKNLEDAAEDSEGKAAKAFRKLGVETNDTETALRQTIAALARMPEGFRQTAAALEVFGRGGKAFLAIAKEAKGDIDNITESLKNAGLVTGAQAKLADEFNDQLVLLEVQLRGLGTQAIPVVLDVLKELSTTLKENRPLFAFLQGFVKGLALGISVELKLALIVIKTEINKALPIVIAAAVAFERIATAIGIINKTPTKNIEANAPAPPEGPDTFKKELEDRRQASLRLQGVLNFDFAAQQRRAQSAIAQAQRDFDAGRKTRQELLDATLAGIRAHTKAQVDALQSERRIKLLEAALAKDDLEKQTQISNQILAIDTQIADKRHQLREREKDERAKFQQEQQNQETAHQQRLLDKAAALDQVKIKGIQQRVALGKQAALDGAREIENIELTALDRQQNLLVKRLDLAGKDTAKKKEIKDEIDRINVERTATEQRHTDERLRIVTTEAELALQIIQVKGEALIATTEAQAAARVITEEEAQRRIAKIRLDAIDAEVEAAKTSGQDLRLLQAQREALQSETERAIEDGRQRDLENERRYVDELERIKERTRRIERDAAEEVIRLMIIHFASRRDIIRARFRADIEDEAERHRQAQESLKELERENRESNKTQEEKLEFEKEINRLREAELRRHTLEEKAIRDEAKRDEIKAGPFGGFVTGLETGQLEELKNGVQSFADVATAAFSAVGAVVNQLASGIGSLVQNFVLLGSNGPNAFRKLVASVLAGVAAQAATMAVMELAYGIAALTPWGAAIYGPAVNHFKAAALFGSIALATGLAGRAVAGGLFQTGGAGGGGGTGGGNATNQTAREAPRVIDLARNQQQEPQVIIVRVESNDSHILKVVEQDVNRNGSMRDLIIRTSGA